MRRWRWPVHAGGLIALLACVSAAPGQANLSGVEQKALQQVALGQARTALFEQVRALAVGSGTTVADWIARSADLERALRLWIRTVPRHGSARLYSDGVCEVDATLAHDDLRDKLIALLSIYDAAPAGVARSSIERAARDWPVVWATGRATRPPRWQVERPPGWEQVAAEGLTLARRAALTDAYEALLDEAGRLSLPGERRVGAFLQRSDAVRDAVRAALEKQADVRVDFAPDRVAVARASIDIRDLMRILTRVQESHDRDDRFAAADFRGMALSAQRDALTASGLGVPPERTLLGNPYAPVEYNAPAWAATSLRAAGQTSGDRAASLDRQIAAARLAAMDALRTRVLELAIQEDVTVAEFVAYHQDLKDDIVLFLSSARPATTPERLKSGAIKLTVELPLKRLWEIVRRKMRLEEVEPGPGGRS